jgi:cell division transport system permease protein
VPVSVDYVARETASNLWRNRLMTVAAVLTVAVSLSLVGASLLLRQGVAHATTQWAHGVNVLVWLTPGDSESQRHSVEQQLHQLPFVRTCNYRSQAYDLNEAKRLLTPPEYQVMTVDTTPASLRCQLDNPGEAAAISRQLKGFPGVKNVAVPNSAIRNIENVSRILQVVFLVLAVILLLSASVLILNTIRLAIFARRREVSVMKLVGATNWFIRVPFMFEGVVQGLLGAVFASLAVFTLHWVLDGLSNAHGTGNILYQMQMPLHEVLMTTAFVVFVGVAIGSLGSLFGIRRFLDA